MFQRPFKIKSNTVTRGSDRKHLKRKVCSCYDQVPQTLVDKLLPNKVAMATIKLTTHSGGVVMVYSVNNEPMFFEEDERIYPTVYTIWQIPDFLPYVSTWPRVLPRLQGGADLMLPGVVTAERGGTSVEGIRRGQCCAINLVGQRSAVGVGVALMSCDQMLTNGMRGKGFRVVHLYGDHLWMMGSKLHPPVVAMETPIESPKEKPCEDVGDNQEMFLEGGLDLLMTGDTHECCGYSNTLHSETGAPLANQITIDVLQDQLLGAISMETNLTSQIDALLLGSNTNPNMQIGEASTEASVTDTNPDMPADIDVDVAVQHIITTTGGEVCTDTLASYDSDSKAASKPATVTAGVSEIAGLTLEVASTPEEDIELPQLSDPIEAMDALLTECFLHALKKNVTQSDLPLLTSTFYRTHILQLCPSSQKLDIKKTSYKKLSRFLHEMEARGVVQIKELSKGVESVTNIDFKHAMVKGFVPKLLVEMSSSATPTTGATASTSDSKPLRVTELYMPSHKLQLVFSSAGYTRSSTLNQKDVRDIVTAYVRLNELASTDKPGLITLDPILCDAVHKRGEASLAELSWQMLMERVLEKMRPAYMISDGNGSPVVRKGKLQPITLTLAQRTGNKKVTLVDNLEVYGISPGELGRTMQRLAAASATVNDLPGRTDTHQLLVQGNAVKILARILQESYGVPLKYIEAIDKIKPAKKTKSTRR